MRLAWVALLLLAVPGADAQEPRDDCVLLVDGRPVDGPIIVDEDQSVAFTVQAQAPIRSYEIWASFGPSRTQVARDVGHSGSVALGGAISVADYVWLGIGMYNVETTVELTDGSTCQMDAQVVIEGNVLATLLGLVSLGVMVGGLGGLLGAIIIGFMDLKEVRDAIKDYKQEKGRTRKWQG